jgi:hypothetical protein
MQRRVKPLGHASGTQQALSNAMLVLQRMLLRRSVDLCDYLRSLSYRRGSYLDVARSLSKLLRRRRDELEEQ